MNINLDKGLSELYVNPDTNTVFIAGLFRRPPTVEANPNYITVFNTNSNRIIDYINLGRPSYDLTIDPKTNMIYVLSSSYNRILAFNYITAINGTYK